ncbi:cation diffusion facilitator family transporter [Leptotrichia sp. oral taxon 212]|uniref:cation diffusion facilitator family transporter n=1 Tax=Leptotrichia sp. oral taxon 212 TaxID=712357 RepID=UPI000A9A83FD|nr:cation diffusion facilitator family transporter [Leptotrichia sp. oral taxon 212]
MTVQEMVSGSFHHRNHFKIQKKSKKTLYVTLFLTLFFALMELFGGLFSNSLSLVGDSFHMFSDVLALGASMVAIYFEAKKPTEKFTYGFLRLEVVVAFLNGIVLMLISAGMIYESVIRFFNPREIDFGSMFFIALVGLIFNIVITWILFSSTKKENNINIKSAMLHFLGDLLNSVGVIISSIIIYFTNFVYIDIIMSVVISVIIFTGGYKISKEAFFILMEAVPSEVDLNMLRNELLNIDGIKNIHELHVWKNDNEEISFTAHILLDNYEKHNNYRIINEIKEKLTVYDIFHMTVQIENTGINVH